MKRFIVLLIFILVYPVFGEDEFEDTFTVADLWFPGGVGSYWVYNIPDGQMTIRVVEYTTLGGRMYKVIEETEPLLASIAGTDPDPFLVFRAGGFDQIQGYGEGANEVMEEVLQEMFMEAGFPGNIIRVKFANNEWILLDLRAEDFEWTVMKANIEAQFLGAKVQGSFEIRGSAPWITDIETDIGKFETLSVDYLQITDIEGEVEKLRYCTMYLTPHIGLVQLRVAEEKAILAEYHLEPEQPPPKQAIKTSGKLLTTWAYLKWVH